MAQQWIPLKRDFPNEGVKTGVLTMRPPTDPLSDLDLHIGNSAAKPLAAAVDAVAAAAGGAGDADAGAAEPEAEQPSTDASDDPLGAGGGGFTDPLSGGGDPLSGGGGGTGSGGADTFGVKPTEAAAQEEDDYEEGFVTWAERRDQVAAAALD